MIIVYDVLDEDEELVDRNFECCGRCCIYYIPWLRLQNALYRVVSDIIFELFITLCIALNVLAMAIEHYDQPETLGQVLTYLNYVSIYILSVTLKFDRFVCHKILRILQYIVSITRDSKKRPLQRTGLN